MVQTKHNGVLQKNSYVFDKLRKVCVLIEQWFNNIAQKHANWNLHQVRQVCKNSRPALLVK